MDSEHFHSSMHSGLNISSFDSCKGYHVNYCQSENFMSDIDLSYLPDQYRFGYNASGHPVSAENETTQAEKFGYFKDSNFPEETKSSWSKSCDEVIERVESSPHVMRKRPRTTFSQSQLLELEKEFIYTAYLDRANRISLAGKLNLKEKQIKVWFQNRRMKRKRDENEQKRRKTLSENIVESSSIVDSNKFHLPFTNPISRNSTDPDINSTNKSWGLENGFSSYSFEHSIRSPRLKTDYIGHSGIYVESFINHYNQLYDLPNTFEPQFPYHIDHSSYISYESPIQSTIFYNNNHNLPPTSYYSELPYDEFQNYQNYYQNNYFD